MNEPRSDGKSTEFGAGVCISAAIGPRRTVGVHGRCSNPAPMFALFFSVFVCAENLSQANGNRLIYGNKILLSIRTMTATVKVISHRVVFGVKCGGIDYNNIARWVVGCGRFNSIIVLRDGKHSRSLSNHIINYY